MSSDTEPSPVREFARGMLGVAEECLSTASESETLGSKCLSKSIVSQRKSIQGQIPFIHITNYYWVSVHDLRLILTSYGYYSEVIKVIQTIHILYHESWHMILQSYSHMSHIYIYILHTAQVIVEWKSTKWSMTNEGVKTGNQGLRRRALDLAESTVVPQWDQVASQELWTGPAAMWTCWAWGHWRTKLEVWSFLTFSVGSGKSKKIGQIVDWGNGY